MWKIASALDGAREAGRHARKADTRLTETERLIRQYYDEDAREKRRRGRDHSARTVRPDGSMSTEDFLREVVFGTPIEEAEEARRPVAAAQNAAPMMTATRPPVAAGTHPPMTTGTRQPGAAKPPVPFAGPLTDQRGLSVHCYVTPQGKVLRKDEVTPVGSVQWEYAYDAKGHLATTKRNGQVVERYCYDLRGRRYMDYRAGNGHESRELLYDRQGRLVQINDMTLTWDGRGSLRSKSRNGRTLRFEYGDDTRLDSVRLLPGNQTVAYEYGEGLMPVCVYHDGRPVLEYQWLDRIRPLRCRDLRGGTEYEFHYAAEGEEPPGNLPLHRAPSAVTLRGPLVKRLFGTPRHIPGTRRNAFDPRQFAPGLQGDSIRLLVFTDQVESVRLLAREDGSTVSYIEYDSFGNVTRNTLPEQWFPLGFACGLNDPFTGFVRFGFRDYDPEVGRFTAKDPARDMRGDGDLYDYCVDDPVSNIDPFGLWTRETFDEAKVSRDEDGKFNGNGEQHGDAQKGGSDQAGSEKRKDKPLWKQIRDSALPLYFLEGDELSEWKEGFNGVMAEEVGGAAGGFTDIAHIYTKLPPAPVWPYAPDSIRNAGPSEEHWDKAKEQSEERKRKLRGQGK